MNHEYIKKIEEENSELRKIINNLEDENSLLSKWKPYWKTTAAGVELVIGKETQLGDVAFSDGMGDGNGNWGVYAFNQYICSFHSRKEAKNYLIEYILGNVK